MSDAQQLAALRAQRASVLNQLGAVSDFRPGTLIGRYRKCGKPGCRCAREGERGHGPSWSLTRSVNGKTVTKIIARDSVEVTKQQIAEYHRFQELVHELVEINERICDVLLEVGEEHDPERAEKGGSAPQSRRKSKPN